MAEAAVATPAGSPPVAAQVEQAPQVETTTSGAATQERVTTYEPQTAPEEAVPSLTELLKNPRFADQYNGHVGERIRRERLAAEQAVEQRRQQEEAQRLAFNERAYLAQEQGRRQAEEAELDRLRQLGDPFDIAKHVDSMKTRQKAWQDNWDATQAERRAIAQVQMQIYQAQSSERAAQDRAMEAHFRDLPIEVQREVQQRVYEYEDPAQARRAALADWRAAEKRYWENQHKAEVNTKVEAEVRKHLAKMNLSAEDFDLGGGGAVTQGTYRFAEDWEKAFANDEITQAEALMWRSRNLPRRNR